MNTGRAASMRRCRWKLFPLVGGAAGLVFGIIFGAVSTRRAGTAFAMITLGIGELVSSSALILRHVFGGEEGISHRPHAGFFTFSVSPSGRRCRSTI